MKMVKWNEDFAAEYEIPGIEKHRITRPAIEKVFGDVKGKKIADLGCGSGYYSRILAKKGAYVTGIDKNENQLGTAMKKKLTNIQYVKGDLANTKLKPNFFDKALLNLVLIEAPSPKAVSKIIKDAHRILKKNGTLVIGDLHPHNMNKKCEIEEMIAEGKNYFDNGAKCKGISERINGKKIVFYPNYHYTLEFYANTLIENGFAITRLIEPGWKEGFPVSIVIEAKKV